MTLPNSTRLILPCIRPCFFSGLKDVQLEVTVCNWDRVTKHAPVGTICFLLDEETSNDAKQDPEETDLEKKCEKTEQKNIEAGLPQHHFLEVSQNPRKAIAKWHSL